MGSASRVRISQPSKMSLLKRKVELPHVESEKKVSLGLQKLEQRVGDASTRISGLDLIIPPFQVRSVTRLSLGRRLVNLLPVAQQTNPLT